MKGKIMKLELTILNDLLQGKQDIIYSILEGIDKGLNIGKTLFKINVRMLSYIKDQGIIEKIQPLEIKRGGHKLRITPVEPIDKFANMVFRPDVINGDPADLVHIEWEHDVDLP